MMIEAFGEPRVFDIVAPLENNGKLFATVNVGRAHLAAARRLPAVAEKCDAS